MHLPGAGVFESVCMSVLNGKPYDLIHLPRLEPLGSRYVASNAASGRPLNSPQKAGSMLGLLYLEPDDGFVGGDLSPTSVFSEGAKPSGLVSLCRRRGFVRSMRVEGRG